jgi:hypothetical protein
VYLRQPLLVDLCLASIGGSASLRLATIMRGAREPARLMSSSLRREYL